MFDFGSRGTQDDFIAPDVFGNPALRTDLHIVTHRKMSCQTDLTGLEVHASQIGECSALGAAMGDIKAGKAGLVPPHLRDAHYGGSKKLGHGKGYRYAHDEAEGRFAEVPEPVPGPGQALVRIGSPGPELRQDPLAVGIIGQGEEP